jgi:ParB family chromosome partitioning protein
VAKRKINAAMILAAGEDAHLQTNEKVAHAKPIDGEIFLELDVEKIKNNPMQPRLHIDEAELKDLTRSIKLHGLIQPIAVIKVGEDEYILKAGQRRWLAHKELGLKSIKAIVQEETILPKNENDKALFEIAIMENTHRDNLNPLELALSLRQAMDKKLYKNLEELSMALSKSKSYVSKVLKVLSLNDKIIEDLSKNKSTNDIESLYEIQKIKDEKKQIEVYFDFINKKLDRKALRELNKKKVAHAKQDYAFTNRAKKVKLEFNTTNLTDREIEDIQEELNAVVAKYFNKK